MVAGLIYLFVQSMDMLLFATYGAMAIRAIVGPASRPMIRFLWGCVGAAGLMAVFGMWSGTLIGLLPPGLRTNLVYYGAAFMVRGVLLSAAVLLAGLPRRCATVPLVASVILTVVIGIVSLGLDLRGVSMVLPLSEILVAMWHLLCAGGFWLYVRRALRGAPRRNAHACCSACGYPLTGLTSPERCPECGATFAKAT